MRIRAFVCAALAAAAALPATAGAAVTVATVTILKPPGDVAAGSTLPVVCRAEGNTTTSPMGGTTTTTIEDITVSVQDAAGQPAGAVAPASFTCTSGLRTCSSLEGTASWTTPTAPGTLTVKCTIRYWNNSSGPYPYSPAPSASVTTIPAPLQPPVVGAITGPAQLLAGRSAQLSVSARDPNSPPEPLAYAWEATAGTIAADPSSPALATWTAPADPGSYDVSVTVTNAAGPVRVTKAIAVTLAEFQASLDVPLAAPRRLCAGESGALFVVDGKQGATGAVGLLTARGETKGFATLPEPALAVAQGAGVLWVTTASGSLYKLDSTTGRSLGKVALADGPFTKPVGIAYDASSMRLWVADPDAGRVRIVAPDGSTAAVLTAAGGTPLREPFDVAIDAAAGRAFVLAAGALREDDLGALPLAAARFLHAFDLSGQYVASYVPAGTGVGQLARADGLAAGGGKVYASDTYWGRVQVLTTSGAPVAALGSFDATGATAPGTLVNPTGLALMANGDLAVANTSLGKVDRFGTGVAPPTCPADADCDGLLDGWEIANGLNPGWAGDALVDLDGDGLNNAEEYAANTSPRRVDSDGDGWSDDAELASGFDPANPGDHVPAVSASGPAETPPGLVRLSAVASGDGTCQVLWTQAAGRAVALRDAATPAPSFVARAAGDYAFDVVPTCGGVPGAAKRVAVRVRNVPPRPDPARVLVASPGSAIALDAAGASDANGDPLAFTWDQTLGAPLVETQTGTTLAARPRGEGLYAFQVAVADPAGATSVAEIPVLVAAGPAPTAIAAAVPADAEAGAPVVLDASASVAEGPATFSWQQVAGPAVTLGTPTQAGASFVPPAPGRYVFEVTVAEGRLHSPPARVEVFVAAAGGALPAVTATSPSVVAVNAPVALEASGGALEYAWRQVSGPAAGLTQADRAAATAVPFGPGFYVFEVVGTDGAGAESRPYRVAFEARAAGRALPQAVAAAPGGGEAQVGQLVFLDGRASVGATRWRWTQVAGPWVALSSQAALTTFRPLVPGRYRFELEVGDGTARGAPAVVDVDVVAAQEAR